MNTPLTRDISMTIVSVRVEMTAVQTSSGVSPTTGFKASAADLGLTVESANLETCIASIEEAISIKLGETVHLVYLTGAMKFSSN